MGFGFWGLGVVVVFYYLLLQRAKIIVDFYRSNLVLNYSGKTAKQLRVFHNEKHVFYMLDIKLVNSLAVSGKL